MDNPCDALDELVVLVPPPKRLLLGEWSWDQLYQVVGTRLPRDYEALLSLYGAGHWAEDWIGFYDPLDPTEGVAHHAQRWADDYRELREEFPQYNPLTAYPEPGGLLVCAATMDGDGVGWLTQGEPDDWPVIVWPRQQDQGPPLKGTMTEVLLAWLKGEVDTPGFPGPDLEEEWAPAQSFQSWA